MGESAHSKDYLHITQLLAIQSKSASMVSNTLVDDEDDPEKFVDPEFLKWVFKSKVRHKKLPPLSETVEFCKQHYKYSSAQKYQACHVVRRTLSPVRSHEILYSETSKKAAKVDRQKQQEKRGNTTPQSQPYREIPAQLPDGYKTEASGRQIFIQHMSTGLLPSAVKKLEALGKKKATAGLMCAENTSTVKELMKKMKLTKRQSCKTIQRSMSQAAADSVKHRTLEQGTRQMYELLHETEHRLMAIQAGASYLHHMRACRKRRQALEALRQTKDDAYDEMKPKPAGQTASTLSFHRIVRSKMEGETRRKKPIKIRRVQQLVHDGSFAQSGLLAKNRQLYYDKLNCIYTILCTMLNMKTPKPDQPAMPWKQLKKLRVDPFPHLSAAMYFNKPVSPRQLIARRDAVSGFDSATVNTSYTIQKIPEDSMKQAPLPVIASQELSERRNTKKALPPLQHKKARRGGRLMPLSKANLSKKSSKQSTESKTAISHGKNGTIMKGANSKARNSAAGVTIPPSRSRLSNSVSPQHTRETTSKDSHWNKQLRNATASEFTSRDDIIFDPATITWDEFVKWGTNSTNDRKPKFQQNKDSNRLGRTVSAMSEELMPKRSLGYTKSSESISRSISQMWHVMRRSFIHQLKSSVSSEENNEPAYDSRNTALMKVFGWDDNNPISHIKLNWMKIKLRGNKNLMREISQREREGYSRYKSVIHSTEISDTRQWKHKWAQQFQAKRREIEQERTDQYVECVEELIDEARDLLLDENPIVKLIIQKIRLVCIDEGISYMTIYRGQARMFALVMSLPAFEVCTLQMQLAMQFILVEVLNAETDLLFPMFKQRGLPIHPGILETQDNTKLALDSSTKLNIKDYVATNKILSSVPPDRPGLSRDLIKRLEKNVIYGSH